MSRHLANNYGSLKESPDAREQARRARHHRWQATACAGGSIGVKGMMVAAKTVALTTVDLFTVPAHIQNARAEFDAKRGPGFAYTTRLADRKPALDYRK
jgi:aminobenzoyl-glutamate utilization protein B